MDWFSTTVLVLTILTIVGFGVVVYRGQPDHDQEQDDRAFFDEHGRWPDEPEDAAVQRPGGYGSVDDLPGRG